MIIESKTMITESKMMIMESKTVIMELKTMITDFGQPRQGVPEAFRNVHTCIG